jgi:hypothetical protein
MTTPDFTFAWENAASPDGPWAHLHVVRFDGREQLSALYRYELTLLARGSDAELDPHDLVGARATLRIATLTQPAYKLVHGVIIEAEEVGPVPEGMLYRAVLAPPLVRAQHRTRCRVFLEKTTREIVTAALLGDPSLALEDGATVVADVGASRIRAVSTTSACAPSASSTTRATWPSSRACWRRRASASTSRTALASASSSSPIPTQGRRASIPSTRLVSMSPGATSAR